VIETLVPDPASGLSAAGSAAPHRPAEVQRGTRVLVVWVPDWPVVAAATELRLSEHAPVAVVQAGQVQACSATARIEGVRRGMRRRDAAAHCPELVVVEASDGRDVRAFETVLGAIEDVSASVTPIRPGLCALAAPSRFYGDEERAAAVVAQRLVEVGVWDVRIGVAEGMFAAEQAARHAGPQDWLIVPAGSSAEFLSGLPIAVLDDAELVSLLRRLGLRTLADFTALSVTDVTTRFGSRGAWLHRLARGADVRLAAGREAPADVTAAVSFEPPLAQIEPIVFSSRRTAEHCIAELARHGLVATTVRIETLGEDGASSIRTWGHSRWFSAGDLVDRLYWQLQADPLPEPAASIRFVPEQVESLADHGEGLWGAARDTRIERSVARLQGMLGPEAVVAPAVQGGRSPRERQLAVPWGDRVENPRRRGLPWPGSIPPPAPTRIFPDPAAAAVVAADGRRVGVSPRGAVTAEPALVRTAPGEEFLAIQSWAGPWPIDELWWDPAGARQVARFQFVAVDGSAWLLLVENGTWWTEARYD
jgi:protein ImuB